MSTSTTQFDVTRIGEAKESIKFPFENSFAKIEEVPEEERLTKPCPLCGNASELAYRKENDGFVRLICRSCAIAYVISCSRIDAQQQLGIQEPGKRESAKRQEQGPFLVRVITGHAHQWVDIETGTVYEPLNIAYEDAQHGLCEQLGRPVLKKVVDDGFPPLVLIAKEKPEPFRHKKPLTVPFTNADKQRSTWDFSPYELAEVSNGLREGLTPRQIAVRVGTPLEAVEKSIEKIGGDIDGTERDKAKRQRAPARTRAARRRKDAR